MAESLSRADYGITSEEIEEMFLGFCKQDGGDTR